MLAGTSLVRSRWDLGPEDLPHKVCCLISLSLFMNLFLPRREPAVKQTFASSHLRTPGLFTHCTTVREMLLHALDTPFRWCARLNPLQVSDSRTHTATTHDAERPAKKRRTDMSSISSPNSGMEGMSHLALATPPPTPSCTPPATVTLEWKDVPLDAHINRSRIFTQTHVLARNKSAHVYATSSRGFQREMPPTKRTRPALRQRRHSVDVLAFPPREAEVVFVEFEPVAVRFHETDEPIQREPVTSFPDARRYRMLERETDHWWPPVHGNNGDKKYLQLPKSSLSNREYSTITALDLPNCWFADSILDVALEMISLARNAESHGICIANSGTSQCLLLAGMQGDTDGDNTGMEEYKKMLENNNWIFIPINDGMLASDSSVTQGSHWSFLAVDRLHKVAHYVDSLFVIDPGYQQLATIIAQGVGNILGEKYRVRIEFRTPNQWRHNSLDLRDGYDRGPCGPFVVTMIEQYVKEIVRHRNMGQENDMQLNLRWTHPETFRRIFNSLKVRYQISDLMARLKIKLEANRYRNEHDAVALAGLENIVEVIADQEPLFGPQVESIGDAWPSRSPSHEEESESDSTLVEEVDPQSSVREDDFELDNNEDDWSDIKQDPATRVEYSPLKDDAPSHKP
ncbi:hypothetical protein K458DRAFT_207517 [Lentithecium fluviatile CBS 122367]|uniref:Ubiquitin-like protease family profile domain-containing protein n=1 Tax=Lentithecium fluviatile CBS 122367 TaxID=1168545 RepID=A0A6G1J6Z3_9PLEO|nr:hypothetical protein K458DRAFT_207517 [Lentithecium fluviatile CBS 122367]